MKKISENLVEKDTITTILKIVSAAYLVMNTIRLGIDLHQKISQRQKAKLKSNLQDPKR